MTDNLRSEFPALQRVHEGRPLIYLDGPAGTQVPSSVIQAMTEYYQRYNANTHGLFLTTRETDVMMSSARERVADFLGAEGSSNISFGQNMTSLTYSLSHAIGRTLRPGDEVLITQLDHEANRGPWLGLRKLGIEVREIKMTSGGELDLADMESKISEKTKLLAMGWASNLTGAVNDVHLARRLTHEVGAWLLLDAVHYAPHFRIDVDQIGCDFLLCSAYKFYGPHVGILYSKTGLLDRLPTDRLRTTDQHAPYKIETGTLNHAAICGVRSAVDFIANFSSNNDFDESMQKIGQHENKMARKLYQGLNSMSNIHVVGPEFGRTQRAPTISFTVDGMTASEVCAHLAKENIFAWDGHFYAIRGVEVLGLLEKGGVTRMGISCYTAEEEIDETLKSLHALN